MTTITCKISESLNAELEAAAKRRRVGKSQIVREALEQNLKRRKMDRDVTVYDLIHDLCGSLSGTRDLATNPKHMEGFGA